MFHGFWLGGEFSVVETGLHRPPALLIRRIAYYSSSSPYIFDSIADCSFFGWICFPVLATTVITRSMGPSSA